MLFKPFRGTQLNRSHPLSRSMINAFVFNEGAGIIVNDLAKNNKANLVNMDPATDWVAGRRGVALDFDGSNDHVATEEDYGRLDQKSLTIVTWINPDSVSTRQMIVSHDGVLGRRKFYLQISADGDIAFQTYASGGGGDGSEATVSGATVGKWHFVAIRLRHKVSKTIWLDEVQDTQTDGGNEIRDQVDQPLQIARRIRIGSENEYNGKIESMFIWDRALGDSEINWIFRNPYAMFEADPYPQIFGAPIVAGGRIMGSIAGQGGLAGAGGIAGIGGGLAA